MTATAADQLRRVLDLLPRIADGEPHAVDTVLAGSGLDLRTFLRDIAAITERYDAPGGFVDGVRILYDGGVVEVATSHFRRPMRVTVPELCAIELGLAMLRSERPPEETPAIDRARARLHDVIARLPETDLDTVGQELTAVGDDSQAERRALLRQALRSRRKVRLAYHKPSEPAVSLRTVCPYALVHATGSWYLVAHCEQGDGLRIFRLDRTEQVELLEGEKYTVPRSFDLETLLDGGRLFDAPGAGTLVVRYSARVARWIAEREGREPDADGTLTIEHPLADADWAVRHVLQYGPDAEVLSPPEVRGAIAERLRRMLAGA